MLIVCMLYSHVNLFGLWVLIEQKCKYETCMYACSGEELYSCIWAKRRGPNVFEFQLGEFTCVIYMLSFVEEKMDNEEFINTVNVVFRSLMTR